MCGVGEVHPDPPVQIIERWTIEGRQCSRYQGAARNVIRTDFFAVSVKRAKVTV
jgi:hypothetical protein